MTSPLPINFPAGQKIYGTNTMIQHRAWGPRVNDNGKWFWYTLWQNFLTSYWPLHLRKQIDIAHAMGANTVRITGDLRWIDLGHTTQAQYNGYWLVVLDYIAAKGMRCYPMATANGMADALTTAQVINATNSWLDAIEPTFGSICIGVDLVQEANGWPGCIGGGGKFPSMQAIYNGVKPYTSLPLTFSTYEHMDDTNIYDTALTYVDYFDFHPYKSTGYYDDYPNISLATTGPGGVLFKYPTYELMLGEFGDPLAETAHGPYQPAHNTTWNNACLALANSANARGGLFWTVTDQTDANTVRNGAYGLTDNDYVPYAGPAKSLISSTGTAASPTAPATPIVSAEGPVLSNPYGTTNDFANMKLYRNNALLASPILGRHDDSYEWSRRQAEYQFSVVNGSAVEGPRSASIVLPSSNNTACRLRGIPITVR